MTPHASRFKAALASGSALLTVAMGGCSVSHDGTPLALDINAPFHDAKTQGKRVEMPICNWLTRWTDTCRKLDSQPDPFETEYYRQLGEEHRLRNEAAAEAAARANPPTLADLAERLRITAYMDVGYDEFSRMSLQQQKNVLREAVEKASYEASRRAHGPEELRNVRIAHCMSTHFISMFPRTESENAIFAACGQPSLPGEVTRLDGGRSPR